MTVYDPDLSNGSAEDKAVAYALALGKPTLVIHPQTRKTGSNFGRLFLQRSLLKREKIQTAREITCLYGSGIL